MKENLNIGDIIIIKYPHEMEWVKKPDPMVIIDIVEYSTGMTLVVINGQYKNSKGELRDVISTGFIEKDVAATRNHLIDLISDDEEDI